MHFARRRGDICEKIRRVGRRLLPVKEGMGGFRSARFVGYRIDLRPDVEDGLVAVFISGERTPKGDYRGGPTNDVPRRMPPHHRREMSQKAV